MPACSATFRSGPRTVSKDVVAADLADIAREAGAEPEWIKCRDDLVAEIGQSTQCEIEASPASFLLSPIVTVTSVGDTVEWDIKPTLTSKQLERQISEVIRDGSGIAPQSVSCESGLEGHAGEITHCDVASGGATLRRTIEVDDIENLQINWQLLAMMTRQQVEQSLHSQIAQEIGEPPDSVTCAGELLGKKGKTVECTVVAAPESVVYLLDSGLGERRTNFLLLRAGALTPLPS